LSNENSTVYDNVKIVCYSDGRKILKNYFMFKCSCIVISFV